MDDLSQIFDSAVNPQPQSLVDIFESSLKTLVKPLDPLNVRKQAAGILTDDNPQARSGFGPNESLAYEKAPGAYPNATYTDPSITDLWNAEAGAGIAKKGLEYGAVGLGEALAKNASKEAPEVMKALPMSDVVNTSAVDLKTGTTLGDVFEAATGKIPVEDIQKPLSEVFDEATNIKTAKKGRDFLAADAVTPAGVSDAGLGKDELAPLKGKPESVVDPSNLPVVDPASYPSDKPYALFIGGSKPNAKYSMPGLDYYDIHGQGGPVSDSNKMPTWSVSSPEDFKKFEEAGIKIVGKKARAGEQVPQFTKKGFFERMLNSEAANASLGSEAPKTPEALTDRLLAESKTNLSEGSPANEAKQSYLENRAADTFEHEQFVRSLPKMSPEEQEALQYSLSGSKVPKSLAGTEVGKLIANPTPAMKESSVAISKHYDELHKALVKRYDGQVGYRENYGPMFLDQGTAPKPLSYGGSELSTRNPNIQSAQFPDLATAVDTGYKPINKSALDDLRTYHKYFIESENALDLKASLNGVKDDRGMLVGPRHLMENDAVRIDHPAFVHSYEREGKMVDNVPLYARPDVYKAVRILLDKPFKSNTFDAFQALNGIMKKTKLSLSLFHHLTLTENALSAGVLKNVLNPNDWVNALSQIGDSLQKGGAAFIDPKWTEIGLRNGLTLGNVVGAEEGSLKAIRDQINKLTKSLYKDAPELSFGDLEHGEAAWDAVLWKHMQPFFKLAAFKNNALVALNKFPNLPTKLVLRQVANQVNAEFGGTVWENVFSNPNTMKLVNFATLAMDWNYSNFKVLANSLSGGMDLGRVNPYKDNFTWGANTPQGYMGRSYLIKSLVLFAAGTEAFNMATTKLGTGHAKPTWKNDEGHKMGVFLFRAKGKNYYLTLNKGLRDSFLIAHVLYDLAKNNPMPFKHVVAKMAPIMHFLFEQMLGHSMTGYDLHFENRANRYKEMAQAFLPMVSGGNSFAGALPVSSGMSQTRFKEEFAYAYAKKDYSEMSKLIQSAARNSVHWQKAVQEVKNTAKQEKRFKARPQEGINSMLLDKLGLGKVPSEALKSTGFNLSQIIGDQLFKALKGKESAK